MQWIDGIARAESLPAVWIVPTEATPRSRPERSALRGGVSRRIAALQLGLRAEQIVIAHDSAGRPLLPDPSCGGLCLSHATRGGIVAVALAESAIGVDIEAIGAGPVPLQALHRAEQLWLAQIAEAGREARFAELWAAKEAYGKWAGTGLPETDAFALLPDPVLGWKVAGAPQARIETRRLSLSRAGFAAAVAH